MSTTAQLPRSATWQEQVEVALAILRQAGLLAERSKLEPGGIVGGVAAETTEIGTVFQKAFLISPDPDGFVAKVTGAGSARRERLHATIEMAAREVVATYRQRQELPA